MKYLIDTNVCIKYLNGTSNSIYKKMTGLSPLEINLCSVVKSELFAEAYKIKSPQRTIKKLNQFFEVFESLLFDDKAANIYGKIRSQLESKGKVIGPYDMQIDSIAIANKLI